MKLLKNGFITTLFLLTALCVNAETESKEQNNVFIFTQTFCPVCIHAKQYMNEQNIEFTELDIETDPQALAAFKRINGRGTPLVIVNKKMKYGFDPSFLQANLYK